MASSEEEGLHARPLPHILGEYICDIAVYFGGGRIGTFSLPPHIVEEFSGGGGTGPPPRILEDFSPFLKYDLVLRAVPLVLTVLKPVEIHSRRSWTKLLSRPLLCNDRYLHAEVSGNSTVAVLGQRC